MRCHWHRDGGTRYFIPGCWGGAIAGADGCYCCSTAERKRREKLSSDKMAELERRLEKLEEK
jgi:hypothetical protein